MLLLLGLACSIDNNVNGKDDVVGFDTGDDSAGDTDTDTTPPAEEVCNGIDDDGDGTVDEGFADDDGNGRVDCLDVTCPETTLAAAGAVAGVEECEGDTIRRVKDAFDIRIQWQMVNPTLDTSLTGSAASPLVVNLDDDNGNGVVDEGDTPEIVTPMFTGTNYTTGSLVVIDGGTGVDKWITSGVSGVVTPVVGDFDNDGWPDIATMTQTGTVICLEGTTGAEKWRSTDEALDSIYGVLNTADLDEDGIPEIFADDLVLQGDDGSTRFRMAHNADVIYTAASAADIDLDGRQEVFFKGVTYNSDGDELWRAGVTGYAAWPVILQADSDNEAEVGWVSNVWMLFEDDGTEIFSTSIATAHAGPPCAGDFDGDGAAEVAWPTGTDLVLAELDGTINWQVPTVDASGLSGCSGYDLDADGALEILYADEVHLGIYDGATGAELYSEPGHTSGTLYEYPTVADIDHDGAAEILYVSNFQTTTYAVLTVLEHNGDGWPRSGSTWGTHDFSVTNVDPDGSVPASPEPSWLTYNLFRARPAVDIPPEVDLYVSVVDVCVADCTYGPARVQVQVGNQGFDDVAAGVPLTLYAEVDTGPVPVLTYSLPAVPALSQLEGIVFDLGPEAIGKFGYSVGIDDDGLGGDTVGECDETNNADRYADSLCP